MSGPATILAPVPLRIAAETMIAADCPVSISVEIAGAATAEQLEKTKADARHLTEGSFLENAPMVAVSSVTGAGQQASR